MNYAIEQRMRFVDFLLATYGYLNCAAIQDYFGMSRPQAVKDIKAYREMAPSNVTYDTRARVFLRTDEFVRVWP